MSQSLPQHAIANEIEWFNEKVRKVNSTPEAKNINPHAHIVGGRLVRCNNGDSNP